MIRFIAALDDKRGIADDHGIPWLSKLPTDMAQYRAKIYGQPVIMGYNHYMELTRPYPGSDNYVATSKTELQDGFVAVADAYQFLAQFEGDIWNIGGAQLYASTIDLADELYLTRVDRDFHCTKFFPPFEREFKCIETSARQSENEITFHFERWVRATRV